MAYVKYRKDRDHKDGYQFLLVASCGYDSQGKQITKTKSWRSRPGIQFKTAERDAAQAAATFEATIKNGNNFQGGDTRFNEYATAYIDGLFHIAPTTKDIYADIVKHAEPFIGDLKLSEIKKSHLAKMYKSWSTKYESEVFTAKNFETQLKKNSWSQAAAAKNVGINRDTIRRLAIGEAVRRDTAQKVADGFGCTISEMFNKTTINNPLCMGTVKKHHTVINSILQDAVNERMIESNPAKGFKMKDFRYDKKEEYIPTLEEQRRIYELIEKESPQLRNMVKLLMNTGMRRGELLGLKWTDVDFEKNIIHIGRRTIVHTNHDGDVVQNKAKTLNSVRAFPINNTIRGILLDQKQYQEEYSAKLGTYWKNENWIFTSEDGSHLCTNTPGVSFKRFIRKNGFSDDIHIHSLRHIFVTNYYHKTRDVYTLCKLIGDTRETVEKVYLHLFDEDIVDSMTIMDGLYA